MMVMSSDLDFNFLKIFQVEINENRLIRNALHKTLY